MSQSKIKNLREKLAWTQADLAKQTQLSIRTIQRIESGRTIPKGHTLKVLAEALEMDPRELLGDSPVETISLAEDLNLKYINLSALFLFGIPFGNILVPFLVWSKTKTHPNVNSIGRRILNFQLIWSLITYLLLIVSPLFLQDFFPKDVTLILWVLTATFGINLFFILKTAISLSKKNYDIFPWTFQLI